MTAHVRWREVRDFPGIEVSEKGEVRTWNRGKYRLLSPRPISPYYHPQGRWVVNLAKDGKRHNRSLAQLVLIAFTGPANPNIPLDIKGDPVLEFIDGDDSNVELKNLRWKTN